MSAWFGDAAPLSGAFLPVPVEVVDHVLATQPPGPRPRWVACLDLRRWQDRALGTRTAFPSRRALATRWGWDGQAGRPGEGAVRGLLASEAEWADPRKAEAWARHPASGAGLKAAKAAKAAQPSRSPAAAQPQPSRSPARTEEAGEHGRPQPSRSPAAARPQPDDRHTRGGHNAPSTTQDQPSPQPPAPRGARDRLVEVVVRSLLRLEPLSRSRDAMFRARLEAGDDRVTCDWLWKRLQNAGELPTRTRRAELGEAGAVAARLWVERRTWEPFDDAEPPAAEAEAPQRPLGPCEVLAPLLVELETEIRPEDVDIWFAKCSARMDDKTLVLVTPNEYYAGWIGEHYAPQLTAAARRSHGAEDTRIEVEP